MNTGGRRQQCGQSVFLLTPQASTPTPSRVARQPKPALLCHLRPPLPPSPWRRYLADLLITLVRHAAADLSARPLGGEDAEIAAEPLLPPMVLDNTGDHFSQCYLQVGLSVCVVVGSLLWWDVSLVGAGRAQMGVGGQGKHFCGAIPRLARASPSPEQACLASCACPPNLCPDHPIPARHCNVPKLCISTRPVLPARCCRKRWSPWAAPRTGCSSL